jgi:hypothetical protein
VIEDYVGETLGMLHHQETQKNYWIKVTAAKKQWLNRQKLWLEQEDYLGSNDFDTELNRSCGKFYNELKKALGRNPIKWYSINWNVIKWNLKDQLQLGISNVVISKHFFLWAFMWHYHWCMRLFCNKSLHLCSAVIPFFF